MEYLFGHIYAIFEGKSLKTRPTFFLGHINFKIYNFFNSFFHLKNFLVLPYIDVLPLLLYFSSRFDLIRSQLIWYFESSTVIIQNYEESKGSSFWWLGGKNQGKKVELLKMVIMGWKNKKQANRFWIKISIRASKKVNVKNNFIFLWDPWLQQDVISFIFLLVSNKAEKRLFEMRSWTISMLAKGLYIFIKEKNHYSLQKTALFLTKKLGSKWKLTPDFESEIQEISFPSKREKVVNEKNSGPFTVRLLSCHKARVF